MAVELFIKRSRRAFDFIFCDPPFSYKYKTELINEIGSSKLMNNISLLMIHHPKKEKLSFDQQTVLSLKETRVYGNSAVDFLKKK